MVRLIISLLVAGLVAGGVYYFLIYDDKPQPAELINTTEPINNPSDAIDAANDAVDQSQNLLDRIDQRAEEQEGY